MLQKDCSKQKNGLDYHKLGNFCATALRWQDLLLGTFINSLQSQNLLLLGGTFELFLFLFYDVFHLKIIPVSCNPTEF